MDVRIADLDKNGTPDIILAKEFNRNRILLGNGKGAFADATLTSFRNVFRDSEDITLADLDGNGWTDVVFASEDDATHEMYLNNGDGTFTDVSTRLPKCIANAVVAWDADGDGDTDLYFGCEGQDRILINNGAALFTDETNARLPVEDRVTQDVLLIDIDRDGDMDVACGNENGNALYVNNGSGVFTDVSAERLPKLDVEIETRKIVKADLNGDGYDDMFLCNMASKQGRDIRDRLFMNDGKGFFTDATEQRLPYEFLHTFDAVFEDLNGDGAVDLFVAYLPNEIPGVYINKGNGSFHEDSSSVYLPGSATGNVISVAMADLNGDGKKDIYLGAVQQEDKIFFAGDGVTSVADSGIPTVRAYISGTELHVSVSSPEQAKPTEAVVVDILGRRLGAFEVQGGRATYTMKGIPAGVYYLTLYSGGTLQTIPLLLTN